MIELKITLGDDGNVTVSGNLDATYHCYAMLETTRDLIHARALERAKNSAIVPVSGVDVRNLKLAP